MDYAVFVNEVLAMRVVQERFRNLPFATTEATRDLRRSVLHDVKRLEARVDRAIDEWVNGQEVLFGAPDATAGEAYLVEARRPWRSHDSWDCVGVYRTLGEAEDARRREGGDARVVHFVGPPSSCGRGGDPT